MIDNSEYKSDISFWIDEKNKQNLINPDLLELFEYLKTMEISTRNHPFSLLSFLSLIKGTSIQKVTIDTRNEHIPKLLSCNPRYIEIKEKYKQEKYQITEHRKWLIINKY